MVDIHFLCVFIAVQFGSIALGALSALTTNKTELMVLRYVGIAALVSVALLTSINISVEAVAAIVVHVIIANWVITEAIFNQRYNIRSFFPVWFSDEISHNLSYNMIKVIKITALLASAAWLLIQQQ